MENIDYELDRIKHEFLALLDKQFLGFPITFEYACNWLGVNIEYKRYMAGASYRKKFKDSYLNNSSNILVEAKNKDDINADFIFMLYKDELNRNTIYVPHFSVHGFKAFCMIYNKSERTALVRRYFIRIEKEYWRVLHQSAENNKKELEILEDRLEKTKRVLTKRLSYYNKFNDHYENLEKQNSLAMRVSSFIIKEYPEYMQYSDYVAALEKKFFRPVNIYLIRPSMMYKKLIPTKLISPNGGLDSSDEDSAKKKSKKTTNGQKKKAIAKISAKFNIPPDDTDFDQYLETMGGAEITDDVMLLGIGSFQTHKQYADEINYFNAGTIMISNIDHYRETIKKIKDSKALIGKGVSPTMYFVSANLQMIKNAAIDAYISIGRQRNIAGVELSAFEFA